MRVDLYISSDSSDHIIIEFLTIDGSDIEFTYEIRQFIISVLTEVEQQALVYIEDVD